MIASSSTLRVRYAQIDWDALESKRSVVKVKPSKRERECHVDAIRQLIFDKERIPANSCAMARRRMVKRG